MLGLRRGPQRFHDGRECVWEMQSWFLSVSDWTGEMRGVRGRDAVWLGRDGVF